MLKDILVNLSLAGGRDRAAEFALSTASAFDAHVAGIAMVYEPIMPTLGMAGVPADIINMQRDENLRIATNAADRFEEMARRNALSAESRLVEEGLAGASDAFAFVARRFDVTVVSQPRPDNPGIDTTFVEAALFNSGRPALIVPYIQNSGLTLDRVLVCWDGSRTATRAVADALPFLARAKTTEVVTVGTGTSQIDELPGIDLAKHLARHGLNVELKRLVAGDVDVANVILSHAADMSADFIVMGGYGHSRWREFVLGGATRGLLSSMTVPTLMSH